MTIKITLVINSYGTAEMAISKYDTAPIVDGKEVPHARLLIRAYENDEHPRSIAIDEVEANAIIKKLREIFNVE